MLLKSAVQFETMFNVGNAVVLKGGAGGGGVDLETAVPSTPAEVVEAEVAACFGHPLKPSRSAAEVWRMRMAGKEATGLARQTTEVEVAGRRQVCFRCRNYTNSGTVRANGGAGGAGHSGGATGTAGTNNASVPITLIIP